MIYVVILNWNGWRDTIECLESLLASRPADCSIVVSDNASSDGSIERLKAWAAGEVAVDAPNSPVPVTRAAGPHAYRCYGREAGERGGAADDPPLVFIETGGNLGFAGGCNVGLRYALARGDLRHAWLLNNDTVVDPGALPALVAQIEAAGAGMCGSTILYYADPARIQARGGGRFDFIKGGPRGHIDQDMKRDEMDAHPLDPASIDYVMGASMLVTRRFLETVGLMWEGYFLFFEEIDWAERGRRAGFTIAYAQDSFVYHKDGSSTGSLIDASYVGSRRDHYFLRNRIIFTRRNRPWLLPLVVGRLLLQMAQAAVVRAERRRLRMMLDYRFWFGTGPVR